MLYYILSQHPEQHCVFICKSVCICGLVSVIIFLFDLSLFCPSSLFPLVAIQFRTELVLCKLSKNEKSLLNTYLLVTPEEPVKTEEVENTLVLKIMMANGAVWIRHEMVASETQKTVKIYCLL